MACCCCDVLCRAHCDQIRLQTYVPMHQTNTRDVSVVLSAYDKMREQQISICYDCFFQVEVDSVRSAMGTISI